MEIFYESLSQKIYKSHDRYLDRAVIIREYEDMDSRQVELYKSLENKKIEGKYIESSEKTFTLAVHGDETTEEATEHTTPQTTKQPVTTESNIVETEALTTKSWHDDIPTTVSVENTTENITTEPDTSTEMSSTVQQASETEEYIEETTVAAENATSEFTTEALQEKTELDTL